MKTVIIYRKSSQAFLDRYHVLLQPFISSKQISFCFWDENAENFASALLDLPGQIHGEKEWRAIVALPVSGAPDDKWSYEYRQDNPFDFKCNEKDEPEKLESSVPLITLSQMLGGIPMVTPEFTTGIVPVEGEEGALRLAVQHKDTKEILEKRQAEWNLLNDRYSTHCDLPSSLLLFAGRVPSGDIVPEDTDTEIESRYESDSSRFWYRNCYPAKARFLTQTSSNPGNVHFAEDTFAFWMTVLTLATNEFPSGTFEAYKLYEVKAQVSRDLIHSVLSGYYNRLDTVRYIAGIQIEEFTKDAQRTRERDQIPDYSIRVEVQNPELNTEDIYIPTKDIGLANDCPIEEVPWWNAEVKKSKYALQHQLTLVKPALDRACIAARLQNRFPENELIELDEYQMEELEQKLSELESEVLSFTRGDALPVDYFNDLLERERKATESRMIMKMTRQIAITGGIVALAVYFLSFSSDTVRQVLENSQAWIVPAVAAVGTLIMTLCALFCLYRGRSSVRAGIHNYNGAVGLIFQKLEASAANFSDYLSNISSYMRGRSLVQFLDDKTRIAVSGIRQMVSHMDYLSAHISMIESWLNDFELSPLKSDGYLTETSFDFDIPPEKNKGYFLETEDRAEIPSVGGSTCLSPYKFITEFSVKRISVFEDVSD